MARGYWLRKMVNTAKQYNARGLRAKRDLEKEAKQSQSSTPKKK